MCCVLYCMYMCLMATRLHVRVLHVSHGYVCVFLCSACQCWHPLPLHDLV
jgi:hypothetical protein